MQKIVMWAPEDGDKIVITKDSKQKMYKAGDIFTVQRAMLDSMSVTIKEKTGVVVPYDDYQMIPPTKDGVELDVSQLKVTYYDAKIGHAAALNHERRLYYSRDNLKTWQEVVLEENDDRRIIHDVVITIHAKSKEPLTEFLIANQIDQLIADQELFKSWGTTVRGKNWDGETTARPNHIQSHIEEKVATRLLCVVEELAKSPVVNSAVQFVAMKDGKPHHIPADRINGVYEALHAKYVELKDWCWLEQAERELYKAQNMKGSIAIALGLPEVATIEEIQFRASDLRQMGEQMDRLKAEYKKIKDKSHDDTSVALSGTVTERSPFKSDLRRPNQSLGIAGNEALQKAVELVTNMIPVQLTPTEVVPEPVAAEVAPEVVTVDDDTVGMQMTIEEVVETAAEVEAEVEIPALPEPVSVTVKSDPSAVESPTDSPVSILSTSKATRRTKAEVKPRKKTDKSRGTK